MMEMALEEMQLFLIDKYEIYDKHKNDDPKVDSTALTWFDAFVSSNNDYFFPAIKKMLQLFDMAINDIDLCHPAWNYQWELEEIKQIVDKMLLDAKS